MSFSNRFSGVSRVYGQERVERFSQLSLCVVGIGGVGSWVAEAFARTGVGRITLIDLDEICVSNTNRQIHTLTDTIGQSKVVVMKQRLLSINSEIEVTAIEDFVNEENVAQLVTHNHDGVVDAIDSVRAKAAVIAHCKRSKIPVVTVGGAGGQIDPTKVQVGDLSKTIQDPLAAKVRYELRRHYGFSKNSQRRFGVSCVYSTEQLRYPQSDGSVCAQKPVAEGAMRMDCANGFGASVMVTATFGMVAAACLLNKM